MKKFLQEFKTFAMRGNVMDLAVGVIVGGAFSSITNSLINDIIMPIVGIFVSQPIPRRRRRPPRPRPPMRRSC